MVLQLLLGGMGIKIALVARGRVVRGGTERHLGGWCGLSD